jgi:hypothetical protein
MGDGEAVEHRQPERGHGAEDQQHAGALPAFREASRRRRTMVGMLLFSSRPSVQPVVTSRNQTQAQLAVSVAMTQITAMRRCRSQRRRGRR